MSTEATKMTNQEQEMVHLTINNIPLDAKNHGYEVLEIQQDGPTIRYLIRK